MGLIKTPSTSALLLSALLGVAAAFSATAQATLAQDSPPAASSKAQRLEWPRTFSGQPDFAFTRDEALGEARVRSARENEPMPLSPTLEQIFNDDSVLDPLRLNVANQPMVVMDASGTEVSSTEDTAAPQPQGQSLMERLMSQAVDLPIVAPTKKPDLSEFRTRLSATISSTVKNWQPTQMTNGSGYDFQNVLNTLSLQAIVTSPVKYAVINQQRYMEGETFRINVPLQVPDHAILAATRPLLPISGTLPDDLMAEYKRTYTEMLAGFNTRRSKDPSLGQQTLILPVRITGITPRQVLLDLGGQPYVLNIRYAY